MPTPWFKFYGSEYLIDPKIMGLTAMERSCWITLLCLASSSEIPGEIKYMDEYKLMVMAGIGPLDEEWEKTQGVMEKFIKNDMVIQDNNSGMITVKNFRKKQDLALTNYERVKKFREKKRFDNTDNVNDNAREEKRREEKPPYPPRGNFAKAFGDRKQDFRESPKTTAAETKEELKRLAQ